MNKPTSLNPISPKPNFFAMLHQLEHVNPGKPPLGCALRLKDEPVRLGQLPHLDFASHDFRGEEILQLAQQGAVRKLYVQNFGLLGPNGALPLHYTEHAYNRLHQSGDGTFSQFLDIFQHRAYLLFYRAWAQSQPHVSFHRQSFNPFTRHLNSLVGVQPGDTSTRESLPPNFRAGLASHFTRRTKTQEGLASSLTACTGLQVRIHPFKARWISMENTQPARSLGRGAMLGKRSWCAQSKLEVEIGPMAYSAYLDFLPGTIGRTQLFQVTHAYVGFEFDCDFILKIRSADIPQASLGRHSRLGRTAWLGAMRSQGPQHSSAQVRIKCPSVPVQPISQSAAA